MPLCVYHMTDGKRNNSFNKYVLEAYSVPITMAGVEESESNKKGKQTWKYHFNAELATRERRTV